MHAFHAALLAVVVATDFPVGLRFHCGAAEEEEEEEEEAKADAAGDDDGVDVKDDDSGDDDSGGDADDTATPPDDDDAADDDEADDDTTTLPDDDTTTADDDSSATPPPPTDADGDGVDASADCDDGDATVFPGAPEACNGEDDDCDGLVPSDELDADSDGFTPCALDCDDSTALAHPGQTTHYNFARADGTFDWDCDGVSSPEWTDLSQGQSYCTDGCGAPWQRMDPGWTDAAAGVPPCGVGRDYLVEGAVDIGTCPLGICLTAGTYAAASEWRVQACR